MKSVLFSILLVFVSVQFISGQDYDDWIRSVDTLGESVEFPCYDFPDHPERSDDGNEPIQFNISTIRNWMLPNLTFVELGGSNPDGRITVSADGNSLTVNGVTKQDIGPYHCMIDDQDGDLYMVKWGLNMKGPYFDDLWTKYRTNTIVACAAAGGFTLIMLVICGVYQCRYIDDDMRGPDGNGALPNGKEINGKTNPAYVMDNGRYEKPTTSQDNTQPSDTPIFTTATIKNEDESKF